jgi:hypothetical protein
MVNIILFVISVSLYYVAYNLARRFLLYNPMTVTKNMKVLAIITLLCIPLNVNGNIFTVLGNAHGRNVISILSFYQKAEQDIFSISGFLNYQDAGNDAVILVGFPTIQKSKDESILMAGISGYQRSNNLSTTILGFSIYQKAGDKTRSFGAFTPLKANIVDNGNDDDEVSKNPKDQ